MRGGKDKGEELESSEGVYICKSKIGMLMKTEIAKYL